MTHQMATTSGLHDDELDADYSEYRVEKKGLPTGFRIRAETEMAARRQLAIAANRLGFDPEEATLTETE